MAAEQPATQIHCKLSVLGSPEHNPSLSEHYTKLFDFRSSFCCKTPKSKTSDVTIGLPAFFSFIHALLSSGQDTMKLLAGQVFDGACCRSL